MRYGARVFWFEMVRKTNVLNVIVFGGRYRFAFDWVLGLGRNDNVINVFCTYVLNNVF